MKTFLISNLTCVRLLSRKWELLHVLNIATGVVKEIPDFRVPKQSDFCPCWIGRTRSRSPCTRTSSRCSPVGKMSKYQQTVTWWNAFHGTRKFVTLFQFWCTIEPGVKFYKLRFELNPTLKNWLWKENKTLCTDCFLCPTAWITVTYARG